MATAKQKRGVTMRFPVVGIGASAGGLEAVSALLDKLPQSPGVALVLVQHLAPQHSSILPELLARHTAMPVVKVENRMAVQPDHVYVIPPGVDMVIYHGHLDLLERLEPSARHLVIDQFLKSLAQDLGERAIGVVLSGVGTDGTLGLAAVKGAGGIAFAQDPATARFDGMPSSAIHARVADKVLAPGQIAGELVRLGGHPYVSESAGKKSAPTARTDDDTTRILIALREAFGVDFAGYKSGTVSRRIERRMVLQRLDSRRAYANLIAVDRGELDELYHDILVMVTDFFREPETYEGLKEHVLPALLAGRDPGREVRVWVPGCAAGEEPYSLAMVLAEAMQGAGNRFPIKILATDINERELALARAGEYPESRVASIPADLRERFMTRTDGAYQIDRAIRDMCVFARHDVTRDPPFSRLDLIVCRNVLIYLGRVLQERVLPMLHYALLPGAFLMLGLSESLGAAGDLFTVIDNRNKIFVKNDVPPRLPIEFAYPFPAILEHRGEPRVEPIGEPGSVAYPDPLEAAAHTLLTDFAPPAVVVDHRLEIVQFFGDTDPYLQHAAGRATLNLLAMAREGLSAPLRELVERVRHEASAQSEAGVAVHGTEAGQMVDLEAVPLAGPPDQEHVLVLFMTPHREAIEASPETSPPSGAERQEILALKRERASAQVYLQSVIQQREKSNEELRAANEEIQSTNEELQSINEELETAKEELQSTNEELRTVNEELVSRNQQLAGAYDDVSNLLRAMSVPTVIVGRDLTIRRFTPGTEAVLNLIATDVGRPVTDISSGLVVPDLRELLGEVIENATTVVREVRDAAGRWYTLRVRPFQTAERRVDGAVLTFLDIDELHRSLEQIQISLTMNESVNRVLAGFAANQTPAAALPGLLQEASATLGADSATVAVREDAVWVARHSHNLPPSAAGARFSDAEFPHAVLAAETRLPVAISLGSSPEGVSTKVLKTLGLSSVLAAPLVVAGSVVGVLLFNWKVISMAFSEAQIDFAAKIAALVALAVDNERLRHQAAG